MSEQDEKRMREALVRIEWHQWILNHEAEYLAMDDSKVFAIERALDVQGGGIFLIKAGLPMKTDIKLPSGDKVEIQIKRIDVRELSDLDWEQWKRSHKDSEILG